MTSQNPTTDKATTSQTGHCEAHCHPWCHGGDKIRDTAPEPFTEQHMQAVYVEWDGDGYTWAYISETP